MQLANQLSLFPGDRLHLINPVGGGKGPLGAPMPHVRPFRVSGIFNSGSTIAPSGPTWPFPTCRPSSRHPTRSRFEVKGHDIEEAATIKARIDKALGYPFYTNHWKSLNKALFEALALGRLWAHPQPDRDGREPEHRHADPRGGDANAGDLDPAGHGRVRRSDSSDLHARGRTIGSVAPLSTGPA